MPCKRATRSETNKFLIGQPCPFSETTLPTHLDVVSFVEYEWSKEDKKNRNSKSDAYSIVGDCIIEIWNNASLPIMSKKSILKKIDRLLDEYSDALKSKGKVSGKATKFSAKLPLLFDICGCSCFRQSLNTAIDISKIDLTNCSCKNKIPAREWDFYIDQMSERKMIISKSIDIQASKEIEEQNERIKARELRKSKTEERMEQARQNYSQYQETLAASLNYSALETGPSNDGEDDDDPEKTMTIQNRHEYPNTIASAVRFKVGKRALCAVGNSMLCDLGKETCQQVFRPRVTLFFFCLFNLGILDESNTLDPSKVRRMFEKYGQEVAHMHSTSFQGIECLMFDGRKDRTNSKVTVGAAAFKTKLVEEHIVLVKEPGGCYVEHLSPVSGKAFEISSGIVKFVLSSNSDNTLIAVGSDGTAVNTGAHNGIIRRMEVMLGRPLQWIICMLHLNELPFQRIFRHYDGKTTGPSSYTGEIGRSIINQDLRLLPLTTFKAVNGNIKKIDEQVVATLSSDQKYLYEIGIAVQNGHSRFPKQLLVRDPGQVCESRWLTKANRILRLYISTENPSEALMRF